MADIHNVADKNGTLYKHLADKQYIKITTVLFNK